MRILSMSGFVPEHICDVVRFTQYSGERNIAHYCGYASDFISQVKHDDSIDGAVFPKTCDSARILSSYLNKTNKFIYQIIVPLHNNNDAVEYFSKSLHDYKKSIENYYNVKINDIPERIEKINARNSEIAKVYSSIEKYRYSKYIKELHNMLTKPLYEQNFNNMMQEDVEGKPVFIIGSFLSNVLVAEQIEKAGMKIVGDYLPESGRLVSNKISLNCEDVYESIARDILSKRPSPSQSGFNDIIQYVLKECEEKQVKGIVFCMQKYCEPYDYFYNSLSYVLKNSGIKLLKLVVNDSEDLRKVELSCEAFADTL